MESAICIGARLLGAVEPVSLRWGTFSKGFEQMILKGLEETRFNTSQYGAWAKI
jgi:hypothetical protein